MKQEPPTHPIRPVSTGAAGVRVQQTTAALGVLEAAGGSGESTLNSLFVSD